MAGAIDGSRTSVYGPFNKKASDYRDLSVTQLKKDGEKTITYKLIQAWPVNISDIALDWGTEGFQEFTVTWRYDYFLEKSEAGNSAKVGDIIAAAA